MNWSNSVSFRHSLGRLLGLFLLSAWAVSAGSRPAIDLLQLPLSFERNEGQFPAGVDYAARSADLGVYLSGKGMLVSLRRAGESPATNVRASILLAGAHAGIRGQAEERLEGVANYLIGPDQSRWRRGVPQFGRVRYRNIYAGVDLIYYGNGRHLEYDFVIAPGARADRIRFSYSNVERLARSKEGDLELWIGGQRLLQQRPVAYQIVDGRRVEVSASYVLDARAQASHIELGAYDSRRELIIDPTLEYATFVGGNGLDRGNALAVDNSGNQYIAGSTTSDNLGGALPFSRGTSDAFVAKISLVGTLLYTTYLGGSGEDEAQGIAVDQQGNAYVSGLTTSRNFPGTRPESFGGTSEGFLSALNASGSALIFSRYLGGDGDDDAKRVALDKNGNVYVAGDTTSPTMNLLNGPRTQNAGIRDVFLYKFTPAGAPLYGTLFGGAGEDHANALAVDQVTGDAYVAGDTSSSTFPGIPIGSYQSSRRGTQDAFLFVASAQPPGASQTVAFTYITFLGGSSTSIFAGSDAFQTVDAIALGPGGLYLTGRTTSSNFPVTPDAFQLSNQGNWDAFVVKLDTSVGGARGLRYGSYLGGRGNDRGFGIAADFNGRFFVSGTTDSPDFLPNLPNRPPPSISGAGNMFVMQLSSADQLLTPPYSASSAAYLPAYSSDSPVLLALRTPAGIYVAGTVGPSTDLGNSRVNGYHGGAADTFVGRLATAHLVLTIESPRASLNGPAGGQIIQGYNAYYRVQIVNDSDSPVSNVVITFKLSPGQKFVRVDTTPPEIILGKSELGAAPAGITGSGSGDTATVTAGSLAPHSITPFTLVTSTSTDPAQANLQVDGTATSSTPDAAPSFAHAFGFAGGGIPVFKLLGLDQKTPLDSSQTFDQLLVGDPPTQRVFYIVPGDASHIGDRVKIEFTDNGGAFDLDNTQNDRTVELVTLDRTSPSVVRFKPSKPGATSTSIDFGGDTNTPRTLTFTGVGVRPASGHISAAPNPIQVCVGGTGATTISWTTSNVTSVEVRSGGTTVAGGPSGSFLTPSTVAAGTVFELWDVSTLPGTRLDSVTVTQTADGCNPNGPSGRITANPNPMQVCSGGLGQTLLSWTTANVTNVQLVLDKVLGDFPPNGSFQTGIWVGPNAVFELWDTSPGRANTRLHSVTVTQTTAGCPNSGDSGGPPPAALINSNFNDWEYGALSGVDNAGNNARQPNATTISMNSDNGDSGYFAYPTRFVAQVRWDLRPYRALNFSLSVVDTTGTGGNYSSGAPYVILKSPGGQLKLTRIGSLPPAGTSPAAFSVPLAGSSDWQAQVTGTFRLDAVTNVQVGFALQAAHGFTASLADVAFVQ